MNDTNLAINWIKTTSEINLENSFKYAKIVSSLILSEEKTNEARKIIINIMDNWSKVNENTKQIWIDLIESVGFYPYLEDERFGLKDLSSKLRKEIHKSDLIGRYFHEEQRIIMDKLRSGKNMIVSAPTSFGKSLLIEELIAEKKYKNVIIIQPTLALLDETRKKLLKYKKEYKLIVRTSQKPDRVLGNIFLLTAERVMEYKDLPKIELFILDEFYKLSSKRDDERSDVLNNAFYKIVKEFNPRFYLLGPNINSISSGFSEKYNAEFFKTEYSLVDNEIVDMYKIYGTHFGKVGPKKVFKEEVLFDLLFNQLKDEQTIIYCSSPSRVRYLSKGFLKYVKHKVALEKKGLPLIDWIKKNLDHRWSLIELLNYEIGIHDGALPKHITSSIIDYFNKKQLKYLFCTTTIIEGVNTSAKNVVFFDSTKGTGKKIDYFDYSNIKGRAGRLMAHFVGRLYNFNPLISKENISIDIPFFEQGKDIADEVLIQLNAEDVVDKDSDKYKKLTALPIDQINLFKKNGVSVWGQKRIYDYLDENITAVYPLINWNGFPKHDQLKFILSQCWNNLLKVGETSRPLTLKSLQYLVFTYASKKSILPLVKSSHKYYTLKNKDASVQENLDEAIKWAFHLHRHWLQYKIPKWISVFNEIQKVICKKHGLESGEYSYYSAQMENDFVQENLAILLEYGIPHSAIKKLEKIIPADISEEQIFERLIQKKVLEGSGLIDYERFKIQENL